MKEVPRDSTGVNRATGSCFEILRGDDDNMAEIEVVSNTSEGEQGASSRTSGVNITSDKEVLKKNKNKKPSSTALVSNKGALKKTDKEKGIQDHTIQVLSSKSVFKEKKDGRKSGGILKDVPNIVNNPLVNLEHKEGDDAMDFFGYILILMIIQTLRLLKEILL